MCETRERIGVFATDGDMSSTTVRPRYAPDISYGGEREKPAFSHSVFPSEAHLRGARARAYRGVSRCVPVNTHTIRCATVTNRWWVFPREPTACPSPRNFAGLKGALSLSLLAVASLSVRERDVSEERRGVFLLRPSSKDRHVVCRAIASGLSTPRYTRARTSSSFLVSTSLSRRSLFRRASSRTTTAATSREREREVAGEKSSG